MTERKVEAKKSFSVNFDSKFYYRNYLAKERVDQDFQITVFLPPENEKREFMRFHSRTLGNWEGDYEIVLDAENIDRQYMFLNMKDEDGKKCNKKNLKKGKVSFEVDHIEYTKKKPDARFKVLMPGEMKKEVFEESLSDFESFVEDFLSPYIENKNMRLSLEFPRNEEFQVDPRDGLTEALENITGAGSERMKIKNSPGVYFDDVIGCRKAKEKLKSVMDAIERPELLKKYGINPERKNVVLLHGPPGTGKTLLAQALATHIIEDLGTEKVDFKNVKYSDLTSMFRGQESINTSSLFKAVEKNQKNGITSIVFLDEVHQIGMQGRNTRDTEALTEFLSSLDGFKDYKNAVFIGATYIHPKYMDEAFVRRFTPVELELPEKEDRKKMFELYIGKYRDYAEKEGGNPELFSEDINTSYLSEITESYSGADIEKAVREAVELNFARARDKLPEEDCYISRIDTSLLEEALGKLEKNKDTNLYS